MAIPAKQIPTSLLARAQAVAIIPNVVKGGFVVGIRHGRGVALVRDAGGNWQAPLFLTLTSGSVGWQAGVQATDLIMVFQTQKSVASLMSGRMTIGVDAAAAAGPVGRQATASTDITLASEILSYSRSRGLFAGFAVDGAGIVIDNPSGAAYYNQSGVPSVPPSAVELVSRLTRYAGAPAAAPIPGAVPAAPVAASGGGSSELARQQLAASWQQLALVLDPTWRSYLELPPEILAGGPAPSKASLDAVLKRYESTALDPKYAALRSGPSSWRPAGFCASTPASLPRLGARTWLCRRRPMSGQRQIASALSQLDFGVPGVERSEPPDRNFPGAHFVRPRPPNPQFQL